MNLGFLAQNRMVSFPSICSSQGRITTSTNSANSQRWYTNGSERSRSYAIISTSTLFLRSLFDFQQFDSLSFLFDFFFRFSLYILYPNVAIIYYPQLSSLPSILTNSSRSFRKIEVYPRISRLPLFLSAFFILLYPSLSFRREVGYSTVSFILFQSLFYRYFSQLL